jgi:surface antigen
MRWISIVAIIVACAACQYPPGGTQVAALPEQAEPVCHDFATPVTAGGRPEQARGQACEQPDGSWQVVQNTPGLPAQGYVLEAPGQPPGQSSAGATPAQLQPNQPARNQNACSSYTAPVLVGGQPRQAVIEACPQPDGSWKITQNTPGLPTQVYQVPPPAASPYPYDYPYPIDYAYPDFFPYWVGAPWFFGLAPSIVVVQRFHHFHHGFPQGFGHGFVRGFGPGFAVARSGGGGGRR